jgi:hypothetical protein
MSAEVPKLHHRLSLEVPGGPGDRPPIEVLVKIADPLAFRPRSSSSTTNGERAFDYRSIAFPAVCSFDFV